MFGAGNALWKQTYQEEMDEIDEALNLNTDPYQQPPHQLSDSVSMIHEIAKFGETVKVKVKRQSKTDSTQTHRPYQDKWYSSKKH